VGLGQYEISGQNMKEFPSFLHMAEEIASIVAKNAAVTDASLEYAAVVIEKAAKKKIGEYQDTAGEFVAWAELSDYTKQDRERQGYTDNDPGLRSGDMRKSIEHVVEGREAHVGSNDQNLVYFELGTDKQPPRSVLGGAAYEQAHKIVERLGEVFTLSLCGKDVFQGKFLIKR